MWTGLLERLSLSKSSLPSIPAGTGGYAKQIVDLCQLSGLEVRGILKMPFWAHMASENSESSLDPASRTDLGIANLPVIVDFDSLTAEDDPRLILALDDNRERKRALTVILDSIMESVLDKQLSVHFPTLIHPLATVSPSARIGEGSIVFSSAVVGPDVAIGSHCIIGPGTSLGPDCIVEDFVRIGPNVPIDASVFIGQGTSIDANACVTEGIRIGRWNSVAFRTVVTEDLGDERE